MLHPLSLVLVVATGVTLGLRVCFVASAMVRGCRGVSVGLSPTQRSAVWGAGLLSLWHWILLLGYDHLGAVSVWAHRDIPGGCQVVSFWLQYPLLSGFVFVFVRHFIKTFEAFTPWALYDHVWRPRDGPWETGNTEVTRTLLCQELSILFGPLVLILGTMGTLTRIAPGSFGLPTWNPQRGTCQSGLAWQVGVGIVLTLGIWRLGVWAWRVRSALPHHHTLRGLGLSQRFLRVAGVSGVALIGAFLMVFSGWTQDLGGRVGLVVLALLWTDIVLYGVLLSPDSRTPEGQSPLVPAETTAWVHPAAARLSSFEGVLGFPPGREAFRTWVGAQPEARGGVFDAFCEARDCIRSTDVGRRENLAGAIRSTWVDPGGTRLGDLVPAPSQACPPEYERLEANLRAASEANAGSLDFCSQVNERFGTWIQETWWRNWLDSPSHQSLVRETIDAADASLVSGNREDLGDRTNIPLTSMDDIQT